MQVLFVYSKGVTGMHQFMPRYVQASQQQLTARWPVVTHLLTSHLEASGATHRAQSWAGKEASVSCEVRTRSM
jgi:hypothetical protein